MVLSIIGHKLRSLVLFFVTIFRRALCCVQRRRRVSFDEPLTDIGVIKTDGEPEAAWNDWGEDGSTKKPNTIQEHIEFYRKQKVQLQLQQQKEQKEAAVEEQSTEDLFEDMRPQITRQKKIYVEKGRENVKLGKLGNSFAPDAVSTGNELGEWDENPGWEGQEGDWDATEALREKRRMDRERRLAEQQQKRLERASKAVGLKVGS